MVGYIKEIFLLILAFMINTEEFLWYILWEYLCVFDAQLLFLERKSCLTRFYRDRKGCLRYAE